MQRHGDDEEKQVSGEDNGSTEASSTEASSIDAGNGDAQGARRFLMGNRFRNSIPTVRKIGLPLALLGLFVAFSLLSDRFLSVATIRNIAVQSSMNAIVGIGQAIVIMGGGIDLSVGALLAVCSVVLADQLQAGQSLFVALLIVMAVGIGFGLINAALIVFGRLAPFIATLGTLSAYRGFALLYTDGRPIYGVPDSFRSFFAGSFMGMPSPVILALIVAVVAHVLVFHTQMGRHILAVGGNHEAARTAGINVGVTRSVTYALSGLTAALASCIWVARLGAAEPIAGQALELTAIAVAVIGGATLRGGRGSVVGAVIGAVIIGTLLAGLTILNIQAFWQLVAIGVVIILAVLADPKRG